MAAIFTPALLWSLATALVVFLVTLIGISVLLPWLRRRGAMAVPNERSSHVKVTPQGAGLVMIPAILVAWLVLSWQGSGEAKANAMGPIALLALMLALVSWWDDLKGLPIAPRLLSQILVVGCALLLLPEDALAFQGLLPLWLDRLLTGFLWAWFINLFNFMDGIDGIAAVETISLSLGLTAVFIALSADGQGATGLALLLAAAAAGFYYWNRSPARIFLGDVGAIPLGFLLGWLLLQASFDGAWAAAIILPLYYLMDAGLTMAIRILRREAFWRAHRQHFYQRAANKLGSHGKVTGAVFITNLVLFALAILSLASDWRILALLLALVAVAALLFRLHCWAKL